MRQLPTQDAQLRLLAKEAEASHLREQLSSLLPPPKASAAPNLTAVLQ